MACNPDQVIIETSVRQCPRDPLDTSWCAAQKCSQEDRHNVLVDREITAPCPTKPNVPSCPEIVGICYDNRNPVFTCTPVVNPDCDRMRNAQRKGPVDYGQPFQHPMYRTTISDYGLKPSPGNFPIHFYPRNCTFTDANMRHQYEDSHFTTDPDRPCRGHDP